jgi:hypothetical protein
MTIAKAAGGVRKVKRRPPTTQMRNIRQYERSARRVIGTKKAADIETSEKREAARTREIGNRQSIYLKEDRDIAAQRNKRAAVSYATEGVRSAAKPAVNNIMLILFTMFGLIVFYALVTSASGTSRFFNSLGNSLALISTSTPLFKTAKTGLPVSAPTSNTTTVPSNSSTSGLVA